MTRRKRTSLEAYFLPWAWGVWTFWWILFGSALDSGWGWAIIALVWAIPFARPAFYATRRGWRLLRRSARDRGGRLRHLWRNRAFIGNPPDKREQKLLRRVEAAERYLDITPVTGIKGFRHRRRIQRRITEVRSLLGSTNPTRFRRIADHLAKLREEIDRVTDEAIEEEVNDQATLAELRGLIEAYTERDKTTWQDGEDEALRE